jgi:sulfoacetaldehyde dehydrogenase
MAETQDPAQVQQYITGLVERARKAQAKIELATQEQVDEMCTRVAWAGVRPDFAQKYVEHCVQETGLGVVAHKFAKQMTKVKGALRDMKGRKSVGVVENDKERGIIKIAKPVGVVGALLPVTNAEATPFVKAIFAIKTRNAIIMAPHPKAQKTNDLAMAQIRGVLKKHGWPEDVVIGIEGITLDKSKELIKQVDLILATGGGPMVKAAYSSGRPAHGVGAGNAMIIVDETADLKDASRASPINMRTSTRSFTAGPDKPHVVRVAPPGWKKQRPQASEPFQPYHEGSAYSVSDKESRSTCRRCPLG